MSLRDTATAVSFDAFLNEIRLATGAEDVFVMTHDLTALRPLGVSERDEIEDLALLDALLAGKAASLDGETFVPILSRQFPLLVVTGVMSDELDPDTAALLGPVVDFHRSFFDLIEATRRRTAFTPAAQLQWSMLPIRAAYSNDLDVAGALHPTASVAGDAYDFAITPGGELTVLCMDAMGHGVAAALSTSLALATMRTMRRAGASMVEQVEAADQAVLSEYDGRRFVTMAALTFHESHIEVVNAGHEPLRRMFADGSVAELQIPADPPLGLDGATDYRSHEVRSIAPGEALIVLSDGAAEARGSSGAPFGVDGVNQAIANLRGDASLQTADRVGRAVLEFVDGELADDLTIVVIQRNESSIR